MYHNINSEYGFFIFFFFFQAEDGIRDLTVTGVQTCALPICAPGGRGFDAEVGQVDIAQATRRLEIGRASCREREQISVVAVSLKKKRTVCRDRPAVSPLRQHQRPERRKYGKRV